MTKEADGMRSEPELMWVYGMPVTKEIWWDITHSLLQKTAEANMDKSVVRDICFGRCEVTSPKAIGLLAEINGWRSRVGTSEKDIPELIALMHSELSEALEGYRNEVKHGEGGCVAEEMADLVIRVFHFCHIFSIDIAEEIRRKHLKNAMRPYRHGGKKC